MERLSQAGKNFLRTAAATLMVGTLIPATDSFANNFSPDCMVPAAPTMITENGAAHAQLPYYTEGITAGWDIPVGADRFRVSMIDLSGSKPPVTVEDVTTNSLNLPLQNERDINTRSPHVDYSVQVVAENDCGESSAATDRFARQSLKEMPPAVDVSAIFSRQQANENGVIYGPNNVVMPCLPGRIQLYYDSWDVPNPSLDAPFQGFSSQLGMGEDEQGRTTNSLFIFADQDLGDHFTSGTIQCRNFTGWKDAFQRFKTKITLTP